MSEKKDHLAKIDEVEIDPLTDQDLETASGGAVQQFGTDVGIDDGGDSNTCPSDGCPTTFTCSCGCN